MSSLPNSLYLSHEYVKKVVNPGDTVIDATSGNGNDTAFLAGLVGSKGLVYSFDIQEQAIEKTRQKLCSLNLADRVELVLDSHHNMDRYVTGPVKAVMFNLGYLPGGRHDICTNANTTIQAIENAMNLICINGIISIVVYYGGDSGFDEKIALMDYITTIDCSKFTVMKTEFVNQINCPPIFVCIEKISL